MTGPVTEYTIKDDSWVHVPLDFTFPFQNGFYTSAYMFSNGVVGFIDPAAQQTYGLCCDGQNMLDPTNISNYIYNNATKRPGLNFNIYGLHTDLKYYANKTDGTATNGRFYTQGDSSGMRFFWENISEYGKKDNLNTFDVGIYPSGNIHIHHEQINITHHDVTVGISGNFTSDVANYTHFFYKRRTAGGVFWNGIGESPIIVPQGGTICESSPISHVFCAGYAAAYAEAEYNTNCQNNPQYDSACPGYVAPITSNPTIVTTPGVDSTVADVIATPEIEVTSNIPEVPVIVVEPEVTSTVTTNTSTSTVSSTETETVAPSPAETVIAEIETEIASVEQEVEAEVEVEVSTENDTDQESSESSSSPADNTSEGSDETETVEATSEETEEVETASTTKETSKKKKTKAESKREKIKKIITDKLKSLATEMANAATLESQQAVQAQINALINYVPGFNAYGKLNIPGVTFYSPEPIYVQRRIPENRRGLLNGLASQLLHEKMVDMQYKK